MAEHVVTQPPQRITADISSFLIAGYVCVSVALVFVLASPDFFHWFMLPLILVGILTGADAVDWVRGRMDTFDPIGLVGLYGVHFFFLAPLLHVAWDYQILYIAPLDDWRPLLGAMAVLNFTGLIVYRVSRRWIKPRGPATTIWRLNPELFVIVLFFALFITLGLQVYVYAQSGGIAGYIQTFEDNLARGALSFTGFGVLFTVSESFPFLVLIGYAVYAHHRQRFTGWKTIVLVLIGFLVLRILFGGLRGSRSSTVFALFWAMGVIHLYVRPVSRRMIYIGLIFMIGFVYIFGFFKSVGADFIQILQSPQGLERLEQSTNRSFQVTVLSDFGRADIQSYLLYRLNRPGSDYRYAWGRTYVGGLLIPVPSSIWPNKPPGKVKEGTDALYGQNYYIPGVRQASQVYALAGEAMLNFGPFAVPLVFVVLGLVVGRVRGWLLEWPPGDMRRLLLPLLMIFCILVLTSDSDNNTIFLVTQGLMPFIVIWLSSVRGAVA